MGPIVEISLSLHRRGSVTITHTALPGSFREKAFLDRGPRTCPKSDSVIDLQSCPAPRNDHINLESSTRAIVTASDRIDQSSSGLHGKNECINNLK